MIDSKIIGNIKCPKCGASASHIERKGKHFSAHFSICPKCGCRVELDKKIIDVFQVGDRIRLYEEPFDINKEIDYTSFYEGEIVAKEKSILNYNLSMKIDKIIYSGKPLPKKSFMYGYIINGIASDCKAIELLTPQLKMII